MKTLSQYLAEEAESDALGQAFESYLVETYGDSIEIEVKKKNSDEVESVEVYCDDEIIFTPNWETMEYDSGSYQDYKKGVSLPTTIGTKKTFLDNTTSTDEIIDCLEEIFSEDDSLNVTQVVKKTAEFLEKAGFDLSVLTRFEGV
jgi:hypothetical protein